MCLCYYYTKKKKFEVSKKTSQAYCFVCNTSVKIDMKMSV